MSGAKNQILPSIILIYILVTASFIGIISFDGIINIEFVNASDIIIVDYNGGGNYTKIQDAIDNATLGDIITVWDGIYKENIVINKSITIVGNGSLQTIINGGNTNNVILITSNWVNLSGLKIINSGNIGNPTYNSGIKLENAKYNRIFNNRCFYNKIGICLKNSSLNKIYNNLCLFNHWEGIDLYESNNNSIENNTCSFNNISGLLLSNSNNNKIYNNTCNNNEELNGIELGSSNNNSITYNYLKSNYDDGISILESHSNVLIKNICVDNNDEGIDILYSNYNYVKKNSCNNNSDGITLDRDCNYNILQNNSCNNNTRGMGAFSNCNNNSLSYNNCSKNNYGICILDSDYNRINNNTCNFNSIFGLTLDHDEFEENYFYSDFNIIENNTLNNNYNGVILGQSSFNTLKYNNISINFNIGFLLNSECTYNNLYYNKILNNKIQAKDNGNNYWNNSNQEGNYWSDYNGTDTGNMSYSWDITGKHQIRGDGIGDTLVPHLGLDYYPFTNQLGWLKPGTPILEDPGDLDNDGNYNLSWISTARTIGYVLEEDDNNSFDSPTEIYNGSSIKFNITRKINGTYYYQVKAYNEKYSSPWSNIVDIIVDWPPDIPENLSASTYPPGNTLNLTWDLNLVDTDQYILEYKNETISNWEQLSPISHPEFTYNHTGLIDGEKYYYRIQAQDHRNKLSNFSEIIYGIPWDSVPPAPPTGLNVVSTTNDSISLEWNPNNEDDLEGYHLFRSQLSSPSEWGEPIATIPGGKEEYIDTGLDELTTYYYVLTAFDEVPNNSSYSIIASGTTIMGQYGPEINHSIEDFGILEDTIDDSSINLFRWFKDKNNDPLVFWIEGNENISVNIYQNNGTVVLIPKHNWNGKETLIFFASDGISNISDIINITVIPVNDPPGPAIIIEPQNRQEFKIGSRLNFSAICFDPDIVYGDKLTFEWSSNLSGNFGYGNNLTNIILNVGIHQITLKVKDQENAFSLDSINISIFSKIPPDNKTNDTINDPKPDTPNINDTKNDTKPENDQSPVINEVIIGTIIIVIIAVVILIVFLFVIFRKKMNEKELSEPQIKQKEFIGQEKIPVSKPPPIASQLISINQPQVSETPENPQQEVIVPSQPESPPKQTIQPQTEQDITTASEIDEPKPETQDKNQDNSPP